MQSLHPSFRLPIILMTNILSSIGTGITLIAISWYIVNREGGEAILGYAAIASSAVLFFLSPYIGVLIDRVSRKQILLYCQFISGLLLVAVTICSSRLQELPVWLLLAVQFIGLAYHAVQMPALFALCQEIFEPSEYQKLSSTMEIQSQFATMVSGGLASVFIMKWDASFILGLNALTYVLGFVLYWLVPYSRTSNSKGLHKMKVWEDIREGYLFLKGMPKVSFYLLCSLLPAMVVLVANSINPVYVVQTLKADASVMGISGVIFALGAVLVGFIVHFLVKRWGNHATSLFTYAVFTLSVIIVVAVPSVAVFFLHKSLFGWGNAGTRVVRNVYMLEHIPNDIIGRVNSFMNGAGLAFRILCLSCSVQLITWFGPRVSFLLLGLLLIVGFYGMLAVRESSPKKSIASRHVRRSYFWNR